MFFAFKLSFVVDILTFFGLETGLLFEIFFFKSSGYPSFIAPNFAKGNAA
jgi:hypothetical protein